MKGAVLGLQVPLLPGKHCQCPKDLHRELGISSIHRLGAVYNSGFCFPDLTDQIGVHVPRKRPSSDCSRMLAGSPQKALSHTHGFLAGFATAVTFKLSKHGATATFVASQVLLLGEDSQFLCRQWPAIWPSLRRTSPARLLQTAETPDDRKTR